MPAEQFAAPASELRKATLDTLDVAARPTAGQGLALDAVGRIPFAIPGLLNKIQDQLLLVDTGTITFDVPSGFTHLLFITSMRGDGAFQTDNVLLRFNGDAGGNYYDENSWANAAVPASNEQLATATGRCALMTAANEQAGVYGTGFIFIADYLNPNLIKTWTSFSSKASSATTRLFVALYGGMWNSQAALNKVTFFGGASANLKAQSRVTLYGIG